MGWQRLFYTIPLRLRSVFRRRQVELELDEELSFHIEQRMQQEIAHGRTPEDARRIALRAMDGLTQRQEECRDARGVNYIEEVKQDLRYTWRTLRRTPVFCVVAVATLALGIGVNTAIFTAVDSTLLRPLPYADAGRLVMLWEDRSAFGLGQNWLSPGNFGEWRGRNHVFSGMAALHAVTVNLGGDGPPEALFCRRVTANFFTVMGVQPMIGRAFTAEEEHKRAPVAVLSYQIWQTHFGANPGLVGSQVQLDGNSVTVIGVMPRDFTFQRRQVSLWMPLSLSAADLQNRSVHQLYVVARLAPSATLDGARKDMRAIAAAMAVEYPEDRNTGAQVVPIREQLMGNTRIGLLVLMAAAGCVLLIACANLAGLLIARGVSRETEMSIRVALGAGRGRLVRQMITEGLVLALAGGALGVAIAPGGMTFLTRLVPESLPPGAVPQVDARMMAFAAALAVLTGLLFSLVPALQVSRRSPVEGLRQHGGTGMGAHERTMRDSFVTAEIALAFILLVGTGLMLRTLVNLQRLDLGFRAGHLLTVRTVPLPRYREPKANRAFTSRVLDGVRNIAGVTGAGYVSTSPFESRADTSGYRIEGRQLEPRDPADALHRVVTADYLQVIGVRLLAGRLFEYRDGPDAAPALVINETFARYYWPRESALGRRVAIAADNPAVWRTVVGVIADVRENGREAESRPAIYQPASQAVRMPRDLLIRTACDPLSIVPAVRNAIAAVEPEQPLTWVRSMDEKVDSEIVDRHRETALLVTFAALAALLAALGLYGVLSYAVTQRRRELCLRMALGAAPIDIQLLVVGHGMRLAAAGLAIGFIGALSGMRIMKSLLYGVGTSDPATFTVVAALFCGIAVTACWVPARSASRPDLVSVLREQ
jgi:predicted permease